jgi:serpin B
MRALALCCLALLCLLLPGTPALTGEPTAPALVEGNTAFALDLYGALRAEPGNLFLSPFSISTALAMTSAGARGETAAEMARVLHLPAGEATHEALGRLLAGGKKRACELVVANALWGQQGYPFGEAFLALTRRCYGAGLTALDFQEDPDAARQVINAWVAKETRDKIRDLLPEGSLDEDVRLVLTNAIYFKARWLETFSKSATAPAPFHLGTVQQAAVPTMHLKERFGYADAGPCHLVRLLYEGQDASMVIIVPKAIDGLAAVEAALTPAALASWLGALAPQQVDLALPKFRITQTIQLAKTLKALGMTRAFTPGGADFTGIAEGEDLFVDAVIHKAFVAVDEEGTEAAAATAVSVKLTSAPPQAIVLAVDRPFLFLVRDERTGSILFIGRVVDPR